MISPAFEFSSIFCTAEWLPVAQMPRVNSRTAEHDQSSPIRCCLPIVRLSLSAIANRNG